MPRKTDSSNPRDWIAFATSDLEGIQVLASSRLSYRLCESKLAEVLEKVVKAELIRLGWPLIKTHDLQQLAEELKAKHADVYSEAKPLCDALADCYFTDRYPGFDVEDEDWPTLSALIQKVDALLLRIKARV